MLDPRDLVLQATIPTVIVPLFGTLDRQEQPGDRLLVASNGVFLESMRKWGFFRRRVGEIGSVPVPYGKCEPVTHLTASRLPSSLLNDFIQAARTSPHVEIGGSILWNEESDTYRLALSQTIAATDETLDQRLPPLQKGEHLVIDCHSHAHHPAFFSSIDDADDRDMTKFAFVVGHCHKETQSTSMRLCIRGIFEDMNVSDKLN